jgi:hypothetical protein
MIHYEIPWNPNRLEQRNGRIDRYGRKGKEVRIAHFVGKGDNDRERSMAETKVGDLEADLEFLMRAVLKVEAIREDLGEVGPVVAEQVEEAMLGRRTRLDTSRAERESEPMRKVCRIFWLLGALRRRLLGRGPGAMVPEPYDRHHHRRSDPRPRV